MRDKLTKFLPVVLLMFSMSCAYSSKYGKCVGFFEPEDPKLTYSISVGNAAWTIVGFEMVIPPIVWAMSCAKCPDGTKKHEYSSADPFDKIIESKR